MEITYLPQNSQFISQFCNLQQLLITYFANFPDFSFLRLHNKLLSRNSIREGSP